MNTSTSITKITKAIAAVQHAVGKVEKTKEVEVKGDRAAWKSAYTPLPVLHAAVEAHCEEQGIALIESTEMVAQLGPCLVTRAAIDDEWIEVSFPIKASRDGAQGFGGGITFARRWTYCALFNLVPDDAEEGQGYKDAKREAKTPRKAAAPGGLGALLEAIRGATLDTIADTAQRARGAHPTGEASSSVERTIESWFVNAFDNVETLDALTATRDAANKIKPRGSDVRAALTKAAAKVEPR